MWNIYLIELADENGNHAEALILFDKALEINPKLISILMNKDHALYDIGRIQESIDIIDKALAIDPTNANILEIKKRTLEST